MIDNLLAALADMLGGPREGTVAFTRCLSVREVTALLESSCGEIAGWQLYGVGGGGGAHWIRGDKAVEMREDKGPAVCLLVIPTEAGAGMDGIYNAGRELSERELFQKAIWHARKGVSRAAITFGVEAVKRAQRGGGKKRNITGRQELEFYGRLKENQASPGAALPSLGLWPVAGGADEAKEKLSHSSVMADRLFQPSSSAQTPGMRVASLSLGPKSAALESTLEQLLRQNAGKPLHEAIQAVAADKSLWLGNLRPAFLEGKLEKLDLIEWRSASTRKLHKWSGLIIDSGGEDGEGLPQFRINDECKLTVKWRVSPETLPSGAATYEVQLLSGDEVIATETVVHRGKAEVKAVFDKDYFQDVEQDTRQEVKVRISAPGADGVAPVDTEDFLLCHGEIESAERTSSGEVFRCVAEGIVQLNSRESVAEFLEERQKGRQGMPDKKARTKPGGVPGAQMLAFRPKGSLRGFRVERPGLLREIEEKWSGKEACVGRWRIKCRPDGNRAGDLEFIPITSPDETEASKLTEATKRFRDDCLKSGGVMSRLHLHGHSSAAPAEKFLNAWITALEQSHPGMALAFTLEITSLSGRTIGLVVLPHHPLRVAWQCGFDTLALQLAVEEKVKVSRIRKNLSWLDGANVPFLLPGLSEGQSFVFADALGFAGVLMVPTDDVEPKASASLMTSCYTGDASRLTPSLSLGAGDAIARELAHYLDTHPHYSTLHIHALRPGDAATVVRAIGKALVVPKSVDEPNTDAEAAYRPIAIRLDLHPSAEQIGVAGRHLTRLTERRRKRSAAPPGEDAWCLESILLPGDRSVPRLRWARREPETLSGPAHMALAFDIHRTAVGSLDTSPPTKTPLLAFGLVPHLLRDFQFENGQPRWRLYLPEEHDGLKLPDRVITERLVNLQQCLQRLVATNAEMPGRWPELRTSTMEGDVELLGKLHDLTDWVVTMDRNAGIEFYDSPRESESVFEAYVIDAVPERDDLGCHQVITSTRKFAEVKGLLHHTLDELGLSGSARNCELLLGHLKGLSGRLAMRLAAGAREADPCRTSAELVALALVRAKCHAAQAGDPNWHSLAQGFFIPLDDVRDLVPQSEDIGDDESAMESQRRADLLFVEVPKRGRLGFTFIEVKYRRHLSQARSARLYERMNEQSVNNRDRWEAAFFSERLTAAERSLQAARIGRVLRFYAEKARRHYLHEAVYSRTLDELAALLRNPQEYQPSTSSCAGYIFCPDFPANLPERQPWDGECVIKLFGPDSLPDQNSPAIATVAQPDGPPLASTAPDSGERQSQETDAPSGSTRAVEGIFLGTSHSGDAVFWKPAITTNPHLMVLGLPGMGKTHSLINLCTQLQLQGISPIVFSYHDDIDEKLAAALPAVSMHDCLALGFNPMTIAQPNPVAHVESAGQLRDIFSAVFPDLGDIQREKLRGAIKQAYEESGWKDGAIGQAPEFRRFVELLRATGQRDRSAQSLLMRLNELDDFHFFSSPGESKSLLDEASPQIIRIHSVANDAMQRASAGFILYRIYQDMFRRGRANRLTHAVVFDEAHRAGNLKLLPTFAKECRKYGLALIVASQEAKDFDSGLFSATGSYLVLRVNEQDAKVMAKNTAGSDQERMLADRMKSLPKYEALFFTEALKTPARVRLAENSAGTQVG